MHKQIMKKLEVPPTSAVLVAVVLISAVALYGWIVVPHVDYLRAVQRYEPVLDGIAKEKGALETMLDSRRNMLEKVNKEYDEVRRNLFTPEQVSELPQQFKAIADAQSCRIVTVDLTDEHVTVLGTEAGKGKGTVEAVAGHLSIFGEYGYVVAFIRQLQESDQKIWIDKLTMRPRNTHMAKAIDDHSGEVSCDIAITIYVIKEKEVPSDG